MKKAFLAFVDWWKEWYGIIFLISLMIVVIGGLGFTGWWFENHHSATIGKGVVIRYTDPDICFSPKTKDGHENAFCIFKESSFQMQNTGKEPRSVYVELILGRLSICSVTSLEPGQKVDFKLPGPHVCYMNPL